MHVGVEQMLYDIALCQGTEQAFIAAESAFTSPLLTRAALNRVCDALPIALGAALRRASAGSGSISESAFTFRTTKIGPALPYQGHSAVGSAQQPRETTSATSGP